MKVIGIIPARYASTRFPGKPLIDINGKSMIQRVYERCSLAPSLDSVWVATDDIRIQEHVKSFNGNVIMTSEQHVSGTDRCAEAAKSFSDDSIIINIQGDEPFIDPHQIELLIRCFQEKEVQIATLIKKITHEDELWNENTPKVVLNNRGEALYFSRQTLPFQRGVEKENWLQNHQYYKHIGIYGFRKNTLDKITALPMGKLESLEGLEQLRWIENGFSIQTAITNIENQAVDVPEDLEKLKKFYL